MHHLQLVGFTTDRRGLILRRCDGARPEASFVIPVTDELIELVTELAGSRADGRVDTDQLDEPRAAADEDVVSKEAVQRPRSSMSVRDIQARLRAGESLERIATEAGVDEDWIERFAPPIRAEQQRIVERALERHLERSRSAPSAVPLRRAVGMALADKGIAYTVAAYEAAWSARLLGHDRWAVEFTYRHRGRDRTLSWTYDAAEDVLTTSDRAAAQLGYVAPGAVAPEAGEPLDGVVGDPSATAAQATTPVAEEEPPARSAPKTKKVAAKKSAKRSAKKKIGSGPKKPVAKRSGSGKKAAPKKKTAAKKNTAAKKKVAPKKKPAKKAATDEPATDDRASHSALVVHTVVEPAKAAPPARELPDDEDPTSARRARAAQRSAPTVQFRSGSAVPARTVTPGDRPGPAATPPAEDPDRPRPDGGDANGAARPSTRRRRQLRAR